MPKREAYTAWCALKTAQHSFQARENFKNLVCQLSHQDLAKPLSDKALRDIPEFALFELCSDGDDQTLSHLLSSMESIPVDSLLPSAQGAGLNPRGLTWFQVLSLAHSLLSRCFWPGDGSYGSLSHAHSLTDHLVRQYQALDSFLQRHLPLFSASCSLPSLPPPLLPDTQTLKSPLPLGHLKASECEMTVVWYRPQGNTQLVSSVKRRWQSAERDLAGTDSLKPQEKTDDVIEESSDIVGGSHDADDIILGLFGFNQKPVKLPQPGMPVTPAVEVFAATLSVSDLARLKDSLRELLEATQGHRVSGRPISRSPSRLRRQVEKNQREQASLQVSV